VEYVLCLFLRAHILIVVNCYAIASNGGVFSYWVGLLLKFAAFVVNFVAAFNLELAFENRFLSSN
jgi:hypothetical protein